MTKKLTERNFDYIHLRNGTKLLLNDPDPKLMDIEIIAHSLANLCRFCGQVDRFYSVAQHCVLVSKLVPEKQALTGLLHDAPEAFCGDLPKPIKQRTSGYETVEEALWKALTKRYGLPKKIPKSVHYADIQALLTEAKTLVNGNDYKTWYPEIEPVNEIIIPLKPDEAKKLFLDRFDELNPTEIEIDEDELRLLEKELDDKDYA